MRTALQRFRSMGRPLRIHVPGKPYHVTSRGNDKQCIFTDDRDHERFLALLAEALHRFAVRCIAYALMWNHFHLIVIPSEHPISRFVHDFKGKYVQWFNWRHRRTGHLFGGRFKGPVIGEHSHLVNGLRYVALNPVAAGYVKRPEDWRWSSYGAVCGTRTMPPFLDAAPIWEAFETADPIVGRQRFSSFVAAGDGGVAFEELMKEVALAADLIAPRLDPQLAPHRDNADFSYMQRFATRPPLEVLFEDVTTREEAEEAARVAFMDHAYMLREIGTLVGRPVGTVWSWIARAKARRSNDPTRTAGARPQFSE